MLDNNSHKILEFLVQECKEGKFKNIEIIDIQTFLPNNNLSKEQITKIILHLEEMNLITVKYYGDDVYCLTILPYAKIIFDKETIEKQNNLKIRKNLIKIMILVCFFAFLGSFLGTIIYNVIF